MCSYVHLSWFYYGSFSTVTRSVGFAGVSLSGNETAGSIIRSDSKSLCKVFCIITYQSQNSHPQILWVTKHQQFPHYCPPKSSPSNDKGRRKKKKKRVRVKEKKLLNLSLGDWIFLPIKSKKDYSQTDTLFTYSCRVQRTGQSFRELDDWVHNVSITKWLNLGRSVIALPTFRCKTELFKTI